MGNLDFLSIDAGSLIFTLLNTIILFLIIKHFLFGRVNKVLEEKRNEKVIGKSLEANIVIHCGDDMFEKYSSLSDHLAEILIVSGVSVVKDRDGETEFEVVKATGDKCERCWAYSETVGKDSEHPTLCSRCASVVK